MDETGLTLSEYFRLVTTTPRPQPILGGLFEGMPSDVLQEANCFQNKSTPRGMLLPVCLIKGPLKRTPFYIETL